MSVTDLHPAAAVHVGGDTGDAWEVWLGDERIWHQTRVVIAGPHDVKGDRWLTWTDIIHWDPAAASRDTVYFERAGQIMTYHNGPGGSPRPHYSTRALDFVLTPDHGYTGADTLWHVRSTTDRHPDQPGYDVTADPILMTVHFTPQPPLRHTTGGPKGPFHVSEQQEVIVDFGQSWSHPDEIVYWYNDTQNKIIEPPYVNSPGGMSIYDATQQGEWRWPDGPKTFRFWREHAGDHISLRTGMYGAVPATDDHELDLIL